MWLKSKRFIAWCIETDSYNIIFPVTGIIIGFLGKIIVDFFNLPKPILGGISAGFTFFIGLTSLVWVSKREIPMIISIRGKPAIVIASLFTCISWGLSILAIIRSIIGLNN